MNTARQLDEVINKLSGILDTKAAKISGELHYHNEPLRQLALKQKNLDEICRYEQKKAEQLRKDIADIEDECLEKEEENIRNNEDDETKIKENVLGNETSSKTNNKNKDSSIKNLKTT